MGAATPLEVDLRAWPEQDDSSLFERGAAHVLMLTDCHMPDTVARVQLPPQTLTAQTLQEPKS